MDGLHLPVGTLVNALAVLVGGGAGLLLRRGLPPRFRRILLTAVGLATLTIGAQMALAFDNALVLIGSLFVGGLIGEALDIDGRLTRLAERVGNLGSSARVAQPSVAVQDELQRTSSHVPPASSTPAETPVPPSRIAYGLVTAFLVFCVGPLTILGALNEGLRGDPTLLYAKSLLDLLTSFVLGASFGVGVMLAAVPLLVYQLALTLLGAGAQSVLTDGVTTQLTAVGGVLILGLGLNLLDVAQLKVSNLLPALVVVVVLELLLQAAGRA